MKKPYLVLSQIAHDGKTYLPPGSNPDDPEDGIIKLTDEEAQRLKDCDAIEEINDGEAISSDLTQSVASGESTAAADALAEQTDKETNQDPLNNKDGGDATLSAQPAVADSTNIEEANGPATAEGDTSAAPEAPGASAPGAEGNLTPASADAVQDPADPAPAVDSTAGDGGQTILDAAATTLDESATGVASAPVVANETPAEAAPAKTRKTKSAK